MRKKLLLADDSITIQKVVELTFPSEDFEVVTAGNGRLAVDKAMSFLPDMVLCDVIMPQLDGYQVCEALRASAELKDVPILLLNGAFEPYDAERAKAVGALGNVSKPFDPPALVARVKEILAAHATSSIARPTQPMSLSDIAAMSQPPPPPAETAAEPEAALHEYAYDESETHPVSTIEVPMDVRELAARSLSLDAPVFAQPQPDVLTPDGLISEEFSDFSETLHGPLESEQTPVAAEVEAPVEASEVESLDTATMADDTLPVEEIESIEEIEEIASTHEMEAAEAPAAPALMTEFPKEPAAAETSVTEAGPAPGKPAMAEPMEFDAVPEEAPYHTGEIPSTLPSMPVLILPPPVVEEFSGEHEFEPEALPDAAAEPQPESMPPSSAAVAPQDFEPERIEALAMPASGSIPEAEFDSMASAGDAPIGLPAAPVATVEPPTTPEPPQEAGAFDGLVGFADALPTGVAAAAAIAAAATIAATAPAETEPASKPPAAPVSVAATLPSAEVPVPVDMVQQIAQRVISQVSERVIREIAWDVIPGLAEKLIKAEIERIKARAESERD